jgi:hypothetical protein
MMKKQEPSLSHREPVASNGAALGLDAYSHPFQKLEIDEALSTYEPVLGGRLKLVQETEENAYTVIMRHPGIHVAEAEAEGTNLDEHIEVSRDIGNILIRIPSLLKRRGNEQKESIACYLYDITPAHTDGIETYLGGAEYDARLFNGTVVTDVRIPPNDTEYQDVLSSQEKNRIYQTNLTIASNAIWTLVITPLPGDDSFDPSVLALVFGGVMIIVSTIGLAIFLWHNMKQVNMIHKAKSQAEAERKIIASLYPENVVERLLDDARAKQQAAKECARNKGKIFDGTTATRPEDSNSDGGPDQTPNLLSIFGSDPIAHHYEETTVLFMDMVGFTSWSRTREPSQVFALLENVYNAFDLLAKRRRVFKGRDKNSTLAHIRNSVRQVHFLIPFFSLRIFLSLSFSGNGRRLLCCRDRCSRSQEEPCICHDALCNSMSSQDGFIDESAGSHFRR